LFVWNVDKTRVSTLDLVVSSRVETVKMAMKKILDNKTRRKDRNKICMQGNDTC